TGIVDAPPRRVKSAGTRRAWPRVHGNRAGLARNGPAHLADAPGGIDRAVPLRPAREVPLRAQLPALLRRSLAEPPGGSGSAPTRRGGHHRARAGRRSLPGPARFLPRRAPALALS